MTWAAGSGNGGGSGVGDAAGAHLAWQEVGVSSSGSPSGFLSGGGHEEQQVFLQGGGLGGVTRVVVELRQVAGEVAELVGQAGAERPVPDVSPPAATAAPTAVDGGPSDQTAVVPHATVSPGGLAGARELRALKRREMGISRDIVARPVPRPTKRAYLRIYRRAAREHGFAGDWYVLFAVGKIESGHGANMGPSVAGAMGPMQFLPSTWKTAGLDGNGDGVENIMDPRDAVPAAARYLKQGGAPRDWHAALYSYNRSDAYVNEVLATAEAYRRAAGDGRVGPYR